MNYLVIKIDIILLVNTFCTSASKLILKKKKKDFNQAAGTPRTLITGKTEISTWSSKQLRKQHKN